MKNIITFIIAIAILLTAGIMEIKYLEETSKYVMADANYIKVLLYNDKIDKARKHMEELENSWNSIKDVWSIFIPHDEIDDVNDAVINLKAYLEVENKEEAIVSSEKVSEMLIHTSNNQKIHWHTIF